MLEITRDDVRRVALWSAGLLSIEPTPSRAAGSSSGTQEAIVAGMLRSLGAVQLDTISVLARSHELVAYARYGALRPSAVEQAYWSGDAFEYWSHAACILPLESWPLFAFRRRHFRAKGERWHGPPRHDLTELLNRMRLDGPITTADVGGAKSGSQWWQWSDAKVALEWLLDIGEVIVTSRTGWRRTYDLSERVVPEQLLHDDLTDEECQRALVVAGARLMGIGTAADIADVHRLPNSSVARFAADGGLISVRVAGWPDAWAHPDALMWLESRGRDRHRTTMLSPFDPIVWHRDRLERIFGMRHRIEAYTPAHRRVHGYFAMPVLHRGRLVARVDPTRTRDSLVAARVTLEASHPANVDGTAKALVEAASWVGKSRVDVNEVVPAAMHRPLVAAVRALSD